MTIPSRDLTDSERPAAPERRHPAEVVGPHRGTWYGHCLCGWRHPKNADRSVVRDAVDAHLVFHHDTGSYMCGRAWCTADRAIKRIRAARGLPERFTSAAWRTESRLRNLGTLPPEVVPRAENPPMDPTEARFHIDDLWSHLGEARTQLAEHMAALAAVQAALDAAHDTGQSGVDIALLDAAMALREPCHSDDRQAFVESLAGLPAGRRAEIFGSERDAVRVTSLMTGLSPERLAELGGVPDD